jgi:hypothetical protein
VGHIGQLVDMAVDSDRRRPDKAGPSGNRARLGDETVDDQSQIGHASVMVSVDRHTSSVGTLARVDTFARAVDHSGPRPEPLSAAAYLSLDRAGVHGNRARRP